MSQMITLRLSEERIRLLDELVRSSERYPTRAAAVRDALDRLLVHEQRRAIDQAIVEGYTRIPPTPEEDAYSRAAAARSIGAEPW